MPFASQFASRAALIPGLGYSVNCQTALFTGKTPDELGYWCEWSYSPTTSPFRRLRPLLRWLALAEFFYPAKRVLHRILNKLYAPIQTKNIPLAYLADFDETGHSVFSHHFAQTSLLDRKDLKKFLHADFIANDQIDRHIFESAKHFIETTPAPGHILITLVRLDTCSHWEGVGSEPYRQMLQENDRYIRELSAAYKKKHPGGLIFVVSDHGMANVERTVHVDLEQRFGKPSSKSYVYFSEGTLWRIWCPDMTLRNEIDNYMCSIADVHRLTAEERKEFGITNPQFGDLIYYTPEGVMFAPSYWGPRPSYAMHGHHPHAPGQHGVCLSNRAGDFTGQVKATDFYRVLKESLESE